VFVVIVFTCKSESNVAIAEEAMLSIFIVRQLTFRLQLEETKTEYVCVSIVPAV
jgi:hypothetical protein